MLWVELFVLFAVSHAVGDFVLQTEWQAQNKACGLGRNRESRRALLLHVFTYTLAFVPALVAVGVELGAGSAALAAALVAGPHLVQDDGRLLKGYMRAVKRTEPVGHESVAIMVDQSLHFVVLLGIALLIGD